MQISATIRPIAVRHSGRRPANGPITRLDRRLPSTYTDSSDAAAASSYPSPSVRYGYPHTRETTVPAVIVPWRSQNPNRVSPWPQATRIVPVGRAGWVTPAAFLAAGSPGRAEERRGGTAGGPGGAQRHRERGPRP